VRRVSSIALIHDALSMSVDEQVNLDEVIDRILPIMNDVASVDRPIRINRVGELGVLDSDRATALIMVITELVQNAIEHAFDPAAQEGSVTIRAERSARWLDVVVHDDGRGLPEGFSLEKSDSLGLPIQVAAINAHAAARPRHIVGAALSRDWGQTPLRAFVRALRRLSARRSSSLMPPHTPES
jgi:two-component sensor histidine kinase